MRVGKIAESILKGLERLQNNSSAIDQISHSYRDLQLEIIMNHLRELSEKKDK